MAKYASKVVAQAQAWLGKNENDGSHKEIIDIYNAHKPLARGYKVKYTDAWCATFVSSVAIKLGYTDIIPTECGCNQMIALFQKMGCFVERDDYVPSPGTILFYDWDDSGVGDNKGGANHVGIVEAVNGDTMYVIEGNYKNAVGRRTMAVNGKFIRGYGVPKYDQKKSVTEVAKEVVDGKWGNGADREKKLTDAGYNYDSVQAEVNRILKGGNQKTINQIAREVINGKWGNGEDRKKRLTAAGYDYNAVQKEVNRII